MNKRKINITEFEQFNEQLRQLLKSGYPLADGLANFSSELESGPFQATLKTVITQLEEGESLSEALEKAGASFPNEYVGLICAGEESGDLLGVLDAAIDHENYMAGFEEKLRKTVFYPLVIFGWTILIFALVMGVAYPVYERLFRIANCPLPWLMRAMHIFYGPKGIFALIWIILLITAVYFFKRRFGLGTLALHIPYLKRVVADVYTGRLAKTLGLLLGAGVRMDQALMLAAASTNDPTMRRRLQRTARRVSEGESLSNVMKISGMEETGFSDLVTIGEEAGTLPKILTKSADLYRAEAQARLDVALRIVGMALIAAVGAWVLLLLSSLLETHFLIPFLTL